MLSSAFLRFAKYYSDLTGPERRTLIKAYGIRFDIIVFGKVPDLATSSSLGPHSDPTSLFLGWPGTEASPYPPSAPVTL